jgi:hypothetical protein
MPMAENIIFLIFALLKWFQDPSARKTRFNGALKAKCYCYGCSCTSALVEKPIDRHINIVFSCILQNLKYTVTLTRLKMKCDKVSMRLTIEWQLLYGFLSRGQIYCFIHKSLQ